MTIFFIIHHLNIASVKETCAAICQHKMAMILIIKIVFALFQINPVAFFKNATLIKELWAV
jgi:hypothetical protein